MGPRGKGYLSLPMITSPRPVVRVISGPPTGETATAANAGESVGPWAADFRRGEMKPKFFRSPLHCVKLSNDGLLYACDRGNNRVQIFKASEAGKPCSNPEG